MPGNTSPGRRVGSLLGVLLSLATLAACTPSRTVTVASRDVTVAGPAGGGPAAPTTTVQGGFLPGPSGPSRSAGGGTRGGPSTTAPAPKGVIKLGTILPLQGGQRDFGEPVLRTTQAFVDELNLRGGVAGYRLQLIAYNACLTCQDEALTAARRLVEQDQVFALVNTYPMVIAFQSVIPYLVSKRVPLVQGGAENQTSDALSPINFASAPSGLFYARFLSMMAVRYAKATKVAIAYLNVPSEANGIPLLERELGRLGAKVVDKEPIGAAEEAVTNMDSAVVRMRAAGADGVLATNPVVLIFGRLAAQRQGWDVTWVGEAAWSSLVEGGCGATCDKFVITDTAGLSYIDRNSPQMHQYLDTMRRRYPGGQITGHTLAAWVGMQLLTQVLAPVGAPDRDRFLSTLEATTNLDLGTTSPLTFGPDRHLGGTASILLMLKNGLYIRTSGEINFGDADPP